jgi:hypothetical protein
VKKKWSYKPENAGHSIHIRLSVVSQHQYTFWTLLWTKKSSLSALKLQYMHVTRLSLNTQLITNLINHLNAELNPTSHLLALGAHHILHVGRIRVNVVAVDKG